MKRLELDGRPGSFFEIERKGADLHVAFGARDRAARPRVRTLASVEAAQAELERLIAVHLEKGYVEKGPPPPPPPTFEELVQQARDRDAWESAAVARVVAAGTWPAASNPELESACSAAPDDPAPWQVYADWLAQQGDHRGEIALAAQRGLEEYARRVIANYFGVMRSELVAEFHLRHGFLVRVGLTSYDNAGLAPLIERVLASPFGLTVHDLQIGLPYGDGDWTPALAAIVASPLATKLRTLTFDASDILVRDPDSYRRMLTENGPSRDDESEYDAYVEQLDKQIRDRLERIAPVRFAADASWSALTALARLTVDGPFRGDLGRLDAPALRELVVRSDRLAHVRAIAAASAPLERLELWCGSQVQTDLSALFAAGVLPSLTQLALYDASDPMIATARDSPLASRVTIDVRQPDALAARYAHPRSPDAIPFILPRDGEPP
jgi:uncharacterized protein (TIGR02996 family)